MADQAVAAKRAAEQERIAELREKLEIDDMIDTPIASLRDRIGGRLQCIASELGIFADACSDKPAVTDGVLAEVRTAADLILGIESLNHIEAGTFGPPEEIDLATLLIGETVDGQLVFNSMAEEWALDVLSEKAAGILEEGGYMGMEKSVGERVEKVDKAYEEAGPYIAAIGQILNLGLKDLAATKALYYCLRELIEKYDGNAGIEQRHALAARVAGEDQLATERQEEAEENAAKALFATRMYETVEAFWIGLKEVKN